jgi:dimethylglycine dehydrogenase
VITERGNVHAEHVVNAAGLWAREVGRMVGIELPVLAMEHQYLITGDMPGTRRQARTAARIDFEGEIYIRQERGGMLMGTYERAGVPWSAKTTPWDFGQDLLPNDLERIAPSLEVGFEHFPALGGAGIRKVVNGPFTFAPDGNPLVGPVRGLRNFWVACGVMAGFSQGGGVGLSLSRIGWSTAIPAPISGAWTSRATATGRRSLHQCEGARELFAPLQHPFPERGTAGGAAAAHDADLREASG